MSPILGERFAEGEEEDVVSDGVVTDLVEWRRMEEEAHRLAQHLAAVVAAAPVILIAFDAETRCTLVSGNTAFDGVAKELPGARLLDYYAAHPRVQRALTAALSGETSEVRERVSGRWWHIRYAPRTDGGGRVVGGVAVAVDVSREHDAEEQLRRHALFDELTGLPNRTLFLDRVAHARARRGRDRLAVLFCDVDRFKLVNASFGRAGGDALLVQVAERIRSVVAAADTVARLGGDELVVLLEDVDDAAAAGMAAERLIAAMREPFTVDGEVVAASLSVGVAVGRADGEELLRDADAAVAQAKRRGGAGYAVADLSLHRAARERVHLAADLRRALDEDRLHTYYQPIVELATGRVVAVEALVRWVHPERGLVLPGDFVGAAEDSGLIVPLGARVLRQACHDAVRCNVMREARGEPPLTVSVNLSARQVADARLVRAVQDVLVDTGLLPSLLMLEVTESTVLADEAAAAEVLQRLRGIGVRFAADDFGTGYSSLVHLRRFAVDTVKLDRSFVTGAPDAPEDAAIIAGVASMANALGRTVVAEGIETAEQRRLVRRLGVTHGQGFLWGHAVPAGELAAMVAAVEHVADTRPRSRRRAGARPSPAQAARIAELQTAGLSLASIASALNAAGERTADGRRWHRVSVADAINSGALRGSAAHSLAGHP